MNPNKRLHLAKEKFKAAKISEEIDRMFKNITLEK